jgi:polyisoprenoid-binding protein YceI
MRKIFLILIVLFTAMVTGFGQTRYTADLSATKLRWKATKVIGEHTGSIELKEGWLEWKKNSIISGSFVINMSSLRDEDLKDDKMRSTLEGHLNSDDFFGVEKYPESTLDITSPVIFKNGKATVKADLTIKGIRLPVEFTAALKDDGSELIFTALVTVDRTKYGVRYGSGQFFSNLGDKAINDEFTLDVNLVVKKQSL